MKITVELQYPYSCFHRTLINTFLRHLKLLETLKQILDKNLYLFSVKSFILGQV